MLNKSMIPDYASPILFNIFNLSDKNTSICCLFEQICPPRMNLFEQNVLFLQFVLTKSARFGPICCLFEQICPTNIFNLLDKSQKSNDFVRTNLDFVICPTNFHLLDKFVRTYCFCQIWTDDLFEQITNSRTDFVVCSNKIVEQIINFIGLFEQITKKQM